MIDLTSDSAQKPRIRFVTWCLLMGIVFAATYLLVTGESSVLLPILLMSVSSSIFGWPLIEQAKRPPRLPIKPTKWTQVCLVLLMLGIPSIFLLAYLTDQMSGLLQFLSTINPFAHFYTVFLMWLWLVWERGRRLV